LYGNQYGNQSYGNQLSGSIPSSLGNLVNLQIIGLSYNQLSGSIPSSLGNLVYLQVLNLSHNKLSGKIPPAIADRQQLFALNLSYNRFTFNGMELMAQTFPFAIYANQARIPVHLNNNSLSVSAGGTLSNNTYQWFMVGQTSNTTIVGAAVFYPSQNGQYYVNVTNAIATQLTLRSDTFNYVAAIVLNNAAIGSSQNTQQVNEKNKVFIVYPNPAKNILHVQTNGNASFSLLDQSGKILLTTNINGNGSINVSHLAAGLYFLKNTSTGAVQKVVIER
ncbi:MAG TPA: T9SS type A sorting domain-containing protein, partial [Chitinophagaceae bacterium]|nr:T9SS type A sorting domain-containing protein [Chitinophagaceae bacterium]